MKLLSMTFYDILDAYEFGDLEDTFATLYPKRFSRHVIGYEKAFEKLKEIDEVIENDCVINIEHVNEEDIDSYEHVHGQQDSEIINLDLSLTPWSEWLGMKFTSHALKSYTIQEIICHCIWEMTFFGYNERDVQRTVDDLERDIKSVDEIDDIAEQNESRRILAVMLKDEIESSSSSEMY